MDSREPSIRWRARVNVLGEDRASSRIQRLEEEVRKSPRVRSLLRSRGRLEDPHSGRAVYQKWHGLHWVLLSLAELGYPRGDESLNPMRDRVLSLWLSSSYFREFDADSKDAEYRGQGIARVKGRYRRCASQQGGALLAITMLGITDDRAAQLVERLGHWQWPDGGWNCDRNPSADTSSFAETLLATQGLAAYGSEFHDPKAVAAARRAAEVFLRRRLFRRVSDGKIIWHDFVRLHFPLYWHYDVLGGLKAMGLLGLLKDPKCSEALDLLESMRLPAGGWPAHSKYYTSLRHDDVHGAEYVDWGDGAKQANPWVTSDALHVLREAGRWNP
ncbi:MAG TPA: hypothetical protein VFG07_05810 [Thermoplasmata archaeon]|nr:hypothetical protein [Thermoplasmata archaeon]